MVVAGILVLLTVAGLVIWGTRALDRFAIRRFRHRFVTWGAVGMVTLMLYGSLVGYGLWKEAVQEQGDELNGLLLMAVGVLAATITLFRNIRRTNLPVGLGGTLVQLVVLAPVAILGPLLVALVFFGGIGGEPDNDHMY